MAQGASSSTNIQTMFVERGRLSPDELSTVIALAHKCGLRQVVSVRTYYFEPIMEWNFGIEARGPEALSGRRISYVTVDIYRHEAQTESLLQSLGKFWVARGEVRTNEFASFSVSNRTIRVKTPRSLPLTTADNIISAFSTRQVHYSDPSWREEIEKYDFSTPNELMGPGKDGSYRARKGGHSGCEIEFTFDGDKLRVVNVSFFTS